MAWPGAGAGISSDFSGLGAGAAGQAPCHWELAQGPPLLSPCRIGGNRPIARPSHGRRQCCVAGRWETRLLIPLQYQPVPFPACACLRSQLGEARGRPCPDALAVLPPLSGLWSVLLPEGAAVSLHQQRPCNYCHLLNMTTEAMCNYSLGSWLRSLAWAVPGDAPALPGDSGSPSSRLSEPRASCSLPFSWLFPGPSPTMDFLLPAPFWLPCLPDRATHSSSASSFLLTL